MASLASELVHSSRDTHDMDTSHRNTIASDGGNRASEFSDRTEISMSTDRNRRKLSIFEDYGIHPLVARRLRTESELDILRSNSPDGASTPPSPSPPVKKEPISPTESPTYSSEPQVKNEPKSSTKTTPTTEPDTKLRALEEPTKAEPVSRTELETPRKPCPFYSLGNHCNMKNKKCTRNHDPSFREAKIWWNGMIEGCIISFLRADDGEEDCEVQVGELTPRPNGFKVKETEIWKRGVQAGYSDVETRKALRRVTCQEPPFAVIVSVLESFTKLKKTTELDLKRKVIERFQDSRRDWDSAFFEWSDNFNEEERQRITDRYSLQGEFARVVFETAEEQRDAIVMLNGKDLYFKGPRALVQMYHSEEKTQDPQDAMDFHESTTKNEGMKQENWIFARQKAEERVNKKLRLGKELDLEELKIAEAFKALHKKPAKFSRCRRSRNSRKRRNQAGVDNDGGIGVVSQSSAEGKSKLLGLNDHETQGLFEELCKEKREKAEAEKMEVIHGMMESLLGLRDWPQNIA